MTDRYPTRTLRNALGCVVIAAALTPRASAAQELRPLRPLNTPETCTVLAYVQEKTRVGDEAVPDRLRGVFSLYARELPDSVDHLAGDYFVQMQKPAWLVRKLAGSEWDRLREGMLTLDSHTVGDVYIAECAGFEEMLSQNHPPYFILRRIPKGMPWDSLLVAAGGAGE